jgi:AcrR family transcriptional regulator
MERKKAETRQRIVVAASELFWSKGYDSTSIIEIAEKADVAPATFYLHFKSKADVALLQFSLWMADFVDTLGSRPDGEPPEQMLAATLDHLSDAGYTSSRQLRDTAGIPVPSVVMGMLFSETALEIAGRAYQIQIQAEKRLVEILSARLGYPNGSIEPQIIASAFMAAWRVAVYGFANMVAAGVDPPAPDELGKRAFAAYSKGLEGLWTKNTAPRARTRQADASRRRAKRSATHADGER